MLNNARSLSDLAVPANNRLKEARHERLGQHSISAISTGCLTNVCNQEGSAVARH
jgi:hypothetical protein